MGDYYNENQRSNFLDFEKVRDETKSVVMEGTKECPAHAIILCAWNNILGPHLQHIWQTEGKPEMSHEMIHYLTTHTLTSSDQPQSAIETKTLLLRDKGLVISTFLFSGCDRQEKTVFALSLIVPYGLKSWYLPLEDFCAARLTAMISKLRVLQDKQKFEVDPIQILDAEIPSLYCALGLLFMAPMPTQVNLNDTIFAAGQGKQLDVQFTRKAIASHLQTCGCSVVIGNSKEEVNMMLSTLSMFLTPDERKCSVYLKDEKQIEYQRDLLLQGFIKDKINLSDYGRDIMASRYPTTLVDMSALEVKQTLPYNEHDYWRHEALIWELQSLWLDSQETLPVLKFSSLEPETLITSFLKEIFLLYPQCGIREAYIDQFQRILDRRAIALIKYVECETDRGTHPSKVTLRKLKHDLDLNPEGNFRIVLSRAEKLRPGMSALICGHPGAITKDGDSLQID
ncbi:guanine nucleotide exchange C9orf72-like [Lytechinus variegatus]|uniref:guanine nucleotide exchange C9orf72-like n=1 Tax=Lytechinus variegatus TaxID=7654 RepID=UPI001BB0E870|nr:guanine nucleotide exchange C9orf72-like [Lytechinus variegatus]